MRRNFLQLFTLILVLSFVSFAQTASLDDKLKEIDAYAQKVMADWNQPGMAIAIVKDDKVIFAKGYGVKDINSPAAVYARMFAAVKAGNTEGIVREMSVASRQLAKYMADSYKKTLADSYKNGLSETTFSATLPAMRDLRTEGGVAAMEVRLPNGKWENIAFVLEDNRWKLGMGDVFFGKIKSPGRAYSILESERQAKIDGIKSAKKKAAVPPLPPPVPIESPLVDENTLFAIASNSKAFTTAALAILVDEKKLNWNDKVTKYLPDFQMSDPYITNELTIRDIVSHRSGLGTFSGDLLWYETTYSPAEVLRRVRYLKPTASFRASYGYQNLMFIAAGQVIQKVSGKPWAQFVKERILTPLGMSRTTTSIKDLKDNAAMPHNESGGTMRVLHRGNVDGADSAAGLNASVADLSKWTRLQLGRGTFEGKQIFSSLRSWEMWQPNIMIPISENASRANPTRHFNSYAMGWFTFDYQGRKVMNHSGGLDGMLSYTTLVPEDNLGFVVLSNSETPAFSIMNSTILDIFTDAPKRDRSAELLKQTAAAKEADAAEIKKADDERKPNTKPTLALADYAGTYSSQMYGDVTIAAENGKLVLRLTPAPNFVADLEHWQDDTFQIKWRPSVAYNFPRGFVSFTVTGGKSDQLKIDQPNNDFWFYELELKRSK